MSLQIFLLNELSMDIDQTTLTIHFRQVIHILIRRV